MALSASCKVYIAFGDGPLVASPTWTEVTAYVRSVRTSRGRSNELEQFGAGTATIVLSNADRRFDPDYSSGPYYGDILPRKQVKVECVYNAVTYPVFRGVVQAWQQDYPLLGRDATCTIQCADLLALLATWDLAEDAHAALVEPLAPSLWWSLGGEGEAVDRAGRYSAPYSADRTAVDALVPSGDGGSRVEIVEGDTATSIVPYRGLSFTPPSYYIYTVSFFIRAAGAGGRLVELYQTDVLAGNQVAYIDLDGGIINFEQNGDVYSVTSTSTTAIADGAVHHVACVRSSASTVKVYIDGVLEDTTTNASLTYSMGPKYIVLGAVSEVGYVELDEFTIFYGTELSSTQIATLAAARNGWTGDRVGARLQTLCDILGVPSGLIDFGTSSSSLGAFVGRADALSIAAQAARSDQGRLFASKAGKLTFQPKTVDMGASSSLTFADDATANAVKYSGFGLELDERLVYNLVTVTGTGTDAEFTKSDTTSQGEYSKRSLTVDTALPSMNACRDVAERLVDRYSDPATRGRAWTAHPERTLIGSATLGWASIMDLELGSIVTLKRSPSTGSAISKVVQLTSIAHDIDLPAGVWTVAFQGAPADTTAYFRWGTSNWGGSDGWS